jgi:hypothetical protein
MTVQEMLKTAHYVVDDGGHRTAVLVEIEAWEQLLAWIETMSDTRLAQVALAELAAAGGDAERAGWVDWRTARADWIDGDTTGD